MNCENLPSEERRLRTRLPIRRRELIVGGSAVGLAGCLGDRGDDTVDLPTALRPPTLLLTWQRDPTSTMTIDWHTDPDEAYTPRLQYRAQDADDWATTDAETHGIDIYERDINRVELTDLAPDTTYEFRFGEEPTYRFRTLPATLDRELRFAVGGDADGDPVASSDWGQVARHLVDYDLDFFVIAGDLAYADGGDHGSADQRWRNWLDVASTALMEDDGRVVPIVAGIGNHECVDGYYYSATDYEDTDEWRESFAPYFYNFFAFPDHPGYAALDVGDYLSIPILDTDHTTPVAGDQTDWLADVLAERSGVDHVIPIYHVPGWPSERSFEGRTESAIREHWVPLFENNGVRLAFEHHDHAHKFTYPLRQGEIDPTGIVYVGDGPLGHSERDPGTGRWYLNRTKDRYNGDVVTLDTEGAIVTAVDINGRELYEYDIRDDELDITHYPHIEFSVVSDVIDAGGRAVVRVNVSNASPVAFTDVDVTVRGAGHDFDFESEDNTKFEELPSGDRHSIGWQGRAPDLEDDVEVVTTVTYTVDGREREESRSDWIPIGW